MSNEEELVYFCKRFYGLSFCRWLTSDLHVLLKDLIFIFMCSIITLHRLDLFGLISDLIFPWRYEIDKFRTAYGFYNDQNR